LKFFDDEWAGLFDFNFSGFLSGKEERRACKA
jgi:hypothetical protein